MEQNQNTDFFIHILSPVHVGAGKEKYWMKGVDYLYDQQAKVVRVFDNEKLGELLEAQEVLNYTNSIEIGKVVEFLKDLEGRRKISVKSFSKDFYFPFSPEGEIKTMIRNGKGLPYIPGSSIKGALRSAIFGSLYKLENRIKSSVNNINNGRNGNALDTEVFGSISNNLMRFIQVYDAMFENTVLYNSKVFNLSGTQNSQDWEGGWKHGGFSSDEFKPAGFTSTYEVLDINDWARFRLKINKDLWDLMNKIPGTVKPQNGHLVYKEDPYQNLFRMVNEYTKNYLAQEKAFFETFEADYTEEILAQLEELEGLIPEDGSSCVLKMGAGTGFHAITGNWQYADYVDTGFYEGGRHVGKKKYKSRKISFNDFFEGGAKERVLFPMGFVKIYNQQAWKEEMGE